jgi:adenosylmethionine-8-amino-7-oxononanoate aminotransferase
MNNYNKDNYHWWMPFTNMNYFLKKMPVMVDRAEGVYLIDANGRKYLDMSSSMWNVSVGHHRQDILQAIQQQYQQLDFSSPFRASNTTAVKLAQKLNEICQKKLSKAFFTCNGSDSVESGIKLARHYFKLKKTNKYKVISLKNSYHGVSYGAMAASGFDEDKEDYQPIPQGFIQIPHPYCYRCHYQKTYPDCQLKCATFLKEVIEKENPDTVAMFLLEPVMGMGGIIVPPARYMETVYGICQDYNVLFMVDEVTTGFCKTGKMFAHENWDVAPDLMALGKGMSNGYFPIGATMVSQEIWEEFYQREDTQFNHGSTYFGHPVGCAASLACINIYQQENFSSIAKEKGLYFRNLLNQLIEIPIVGEIRSMGMMFAIEFVNDKTTKTPIDRKLMEKIIGSCYMLGLWGHFSGNYMMLFPPFVCSHEQLQEVYQLLKKIISNVAKKV